MSTNGLQRLVDLDKIKNTYTWISHDIKAQELPLNLSKPFIESSINRSRSSNSYPLG
jgi:hypothetical protein